MQHHSTDATTKESATRLPKTRFSYTESVPPKEVKWCSMKMAEDEARQEGNFRAGSVVLEFKCCSRPCYRPILSLMHV